MGQHDVNFDLVGEPRSIRSGPRPCVYEPQAYGTLKLVALEVGEGRPGRGPGSDRPRPPMLPVGSGNRYGSEPDGFYERHYWLYKSNPMGAFADWNPTVSCRGQGDNGG